MPLIFLDAVAAVNPFLRRIPSWLRERYIVESVVELLKLKSPSIDGKITARYRLMIAHVRKPSNEKTKKKQFKPLS